MFSISDRSGTPCWLIGDIHYDFTRAFEHVDPEKTLWVMGDLAHKGPAVGHVYKNEDHETEIGYFIISFLGEIGGSGLIMSIALPSDYSETISENNRAEFEREIDLHFPHWKIIVEAISFLFESNPWCAYKQPHQKDGDTDATLFTFEFANDKKAKIASKEELARMENTKKLCLFHEL